MALKQTADDNETKYGKFVANVVRRNFYMDNLLKSTVTVEQAIELALKFIALLQEGSFHLTKFLSNQREVLQAIPVRERASPTLDLDLDQLPINRTLGLSWDTEPDQFYFTSISTDKPATKQGILSVMSLLFDLLGFLALMFSLSRSCFKNCGNRRWDGTTRYVISNSESGNNGSIHYPICPKLGLQDATSTRT